MDHLDALSMTMARWFAETTLVALALALVAHLVGRLRGPGPAIRHLLWLVVLAKLMTPPLVHWPWSLPVGLVATNTFEAPVARRATVALVPLRSAREVPLLDDREPEANASFASQPRSPVEPRPDFPSPVAWLVSAWLVGSVLFGADQVRRIVRFRRRLRGARAGPGLAGGRGRGDRSADVGRLAADPGRRRPGCAAALVPGPARAVRPRRVAGVARTRPLARGPGP